MGLDKLGPHRKSEPFEDIGDSTLGLEFLSIDTLQMILTELKTMNSYLALMNNENDPPDRETLDDAD